MLVSNLDQALLDFKIVTTPMENTVRYINSQITLYNALTTQVPLNICERPLQLPWHTPRCNHHERKHTF